MFYMTTQLVCIVYHVTLVVLHAGNTCSSYTHGEVSGYTNIFRVDPLHAIIIHSRPEILKQIYHDSTLRSEVDISRHKTSLERKHFKPPLK